MKALWTIAIKEIRDNLRDRRALFFALLYGPLLLPALMIGPLIVNVGNQVIDFDEPKPVDVLGAERAPNLMRHLRANNLDARPAPEPIDPAIRNGETPLVLEIPADYGDRFSAGEPARLVVHYNANDDASVRDRRQLVAVLEDYGKRLRSQRFLVRGLDEQLFKPLMIVERDLADEAFEARFIAHILPFLMMFSMLMGGFYLAVDSTAGERERKSLEPLLALPLARITLVLGKYLALLAFVMVSLVLPLITAFLLFGLLPEDLLDIGLDFGPGTFITALGAGVPLALLIAAFLLAVAAFARDTKEAQTHLSLAMLLPMLPFFGLQFLDLSRTLATLAVPVLGQFQLLEMAVAGQAIPLTFHLVAAATSLLLALVCLALALRLYSRERILL